MTSTVQSKSEAVNRLIVPFLSSSYQSLLPFSVLYALQTMAGCHSIGPYKSDADLSNLFWTLYERLSDENCCQNDRLHVRMNFGACCSCGRFTQFTHAREQADLEDATLFCSLFLESLPVASPQISLRLVLVLNNASHSLHFSMSG